MTVIRIADFFCGVGGIRLGIEQAGKKKGISVKCVYSNDSDKYTRITYEKNFPCKVVPESITEISTEDIPDFDLLLAGFPCQSFSVAGNRLGFGDSRGELFFEIIRILKAKKPRAFLLENVKNLKTHNQGKTYGTIIEALEGVGYHVKSQVMNSCTHGNIPQNRERIFIVGFLEPNTFRFPGEIPLDVTVTSLLEDDEKIPDKYFYTEKSKIFGKLRDVVVEHGKVYQYRRGMVRENKSSVCPTLVKTGGTGGHNVPIILSENGIRKLTPRECFRLQGFPDDFLLPLADSHLYCQAGNTVTVPVIRRIATQILKVWD